MGVASGVGWSLTHRLAWPNQCQDIWPEQPRGRVSPTRQKTRRENYNLKDNPCSKFRFFGGKSGFKPCSDCFVFVCLNLLCEYGQPCRRLVVLIILMVVLVVHRPPVRTTLSMSLMLSCFGLQAQLTSETHLPLPPWPPPARLFRPLPRLQTRLLRPRSRRHPPKSWLLRPRRRGRRRGLLRPLVVRQWARSQFWVLTLVAPCLCFMPTSMRNGGAQCRASGPF